MDTESIPRLAGLFAEYQRAKAALDNFEHGGKIIAMQVSSGQPAPAGRPPLSVTVTTAGIDYPPQMVDEIKRALRERCAAIAKEVTDMGVTGMEARA